MYVKLAMRNMRRCAKDYLIYIITIVLTVTLMYSAMALGYSEDIISMSENMFILVKGAFIISVLVALISSFVICYAVRFMLGQRRKEFAAYELLGMETGTIQKLFVLENGVIGLFSFFIGIMAGTFLSGIFVQIVKRIFDTPHAYRITFSIDAFITTLLLFAVMYGVGIFRAAGILRQKNIAQLLYDNRKNEEVRPHNVRLRLIIVCLSVLAAVDGAFLAEKGIAVSSNASWLYFITAITLLLSGIYGVYRNVPDLIIYLFKRNIHIRYPHGNLFYFGQIGSRINTCGRMMAVTAILLTVSLTAMFTGLATGSGYKANMEIYYPYDAGAAVDAPLTKDSFTPMLTFVEERYPVQDSLTYYLYNTVQNPIDALSLSDYNHLRAILGLDMVELQADQYLVHCDTWTDRAEIEKRLGEHPDITLAGTSLSNTPARVYTEPMELYRMAGTNGYVLVVPDAVADRLPADKIRVVMKLKDGGRPELRGELQRFINDTDWNSKLQPGRTLPERTAMGVTVKAWGVANSLTGFTTISFCGLYLSIVFILLSCTILAFEQLSSIENNKRRYQIIDKMGVSKKLQNRLIRRELSTFFFIPLILPLIVMLILTVRAQDLYGVYLLQESLIPISFAVTLAVFGPIYLAYYLAACYLYRKNVEQA